MFAEELGGNASRRRQQENRNRRRQLKTEKDKKAARSAAVPSASSTTTPSAGAATADAPATTTAASVAQTSASNALNPAPSALAAPSITPSTIDPAAAAVTATTSKQPTAVANALQQRQLRQQSQLQQKSSIKIQSLVRSFLSNTKLLNNHSTLLKQRLSDLNTLRNLLKQKAPDHPYVPPPATTTALVQQLLFLATLTPYKRHDESDTTGTPTGPIRGLILRTATDIPSRLQECLDYTLIPGLVATTTTKVDNNNLNPLGVWLESVEGRYRLEQLLCLILLVMTTKTNKGVSLECLTSISTFLHLILGCSSSENPSLSPDQQAIVDHCRARLLPITLRTPIMTTTIPSISAVSHKSQGNSRSSSSGIVSATKATLMNLNLIQALRQLLLFSIGGNGDSSSSSPIPEMATERREACIPASDRAHADVLFQLVLDAITKEPTIQTSSLSSKPQHRQLKAQFFESILTIPLLTWKISPNSISKLLATSNNQPPTSSGTDRTNKQQQEPVLLVSMISAFVELHKDALAQGKIGVVLPIVNVPLSRCPATNTQCLLANVIALARICPSLNGADPIQLDYQASSTLFYFVATLLDDVPLGTLLSRDSAVEWVTDGKGHHTPIVLSAVILDQCKALLVDSFVRKLFSCAIDADILQTQHVLASKTEKDIKHEKDLKEEGSSAASLAAKEARVDRSRGWLTSKWANKVKKGVSSLLSSSSVTASSSGATKSQVRENYSGEGEGHLLETSAVARKLAGGEHDGSTAKAFLASKETATTASTTTVARRSHTYSPVLLLALCRSFSIILARWGGGGKEDIVTRKDEDKKGGKPERATAVRDPCTTALLSVLCFGTDIVRTAWAMIQSDKIIVSDLYAVIDQKNGSAVRSLNIRPSFRAVKSDSGRMENDGVSLLYLFCCAFSHSLIITDDAEIYDMGRPLPLHQIRRAIQLLKKLLCLACDSPSSTTENEYFGRALVSVSSRTMRDLYDRSSRRPLCVPKLWLVENLMVKEIQRCKSHGDYVALLSTPVLRICPFLVSFKRRLKLFERIVTTSRIDIQGVNDANPFNPNPLQPGIPVRIMRGRILEDGLATLNKLGRNLRQRINVQYLNEAGARESGVDAGGLFKEFWTDLCGIAFNPNYALFRVTDGMFWLINFVLVSFCFALSNIKVFWHCR